MSGKPSPVLLACVAIDLMVLIGLVIWRPFGAIAMLFAATALFTGALLGLVLATAAPTRSAVGDPQPHPAPAPEPDPVALRRGWERAVEHHKAVLDAYGAYELDPAMLLQYPALWDLSAPAVTNFHDALAMVGDLATDDYPDPKTARDYIDAVAMLRRDWAAADRYARSTGTGNLAAADATACDRALKLLRHADGTTGAERTAYLKQVISTVDGLGERGAIAAPERIQAELAAAVRRAIEQ